MNGLNSLGPAKPKQNHQNTAINPFAQALAETERHSSGGVNNQNRNHDPLQETMAQAGSSLANFNQANQFDNSELLAQQQKEMADKAKKEQLRRKLHEQVNPVDQKAVFDAREKQVKEEIDKIRQELKMLAVEVSEFHQEIDLSLMAPVSNPGQEGKYYLNFFHQLRAFIMLLRQKIHSARTWAKQMNQKKKRKKGPGAMFMPAETKAVHDNMHHERSSAHSGN
ncbi:MAG: DUF5660 family protein [Patescibacteria group bacterium]